MPNDVCGKVIARNGSKYAPKAGNRCFRLQGHRGGCDEFPYLAHLKKAESKVAAKIRRDATMTTGAAWKSADAGPNRMPRWAASWEDADLIAAGIDVANLSDLVVAKVREKAASYDDCMAVALHLTWMAYQMPDAPRPPADIGEYLRQACGPITPGSTKCLICLEPLSFSLFALAQRGRAEIETAHRSPRQHTADNVGFAHRACNIAQGPRSLDEFFGWMRAVLDRVEGAERS